MSLTLETDNWFPSKVTDYLTLIWNYNGKPLKLNQTIPITITLFISENIIGINDFSFDITIIGKSS